MIDAFRRGQLNGADDPHRHPHHLTGDKLLVSPSKRSRELYKYFNPPSFQHKSPSSSSHNGLLASQAQLVALRLQSRCLINLLDASHQYRIAEALPSLLFNSDGQVENVSELAWANCRLDHIDNSVCQFTINATEPSDGEFAYFEAADMPNDPRFCNSSFVTGPPFFKYYFGMPLRTKNGITIGALAIVDSKAREPITMQERFFMKTVADNIMTYFELERDSNERLRASEMKTSLNLFVESVRDGSNSIPPDNHLSLNGNTSSPNSLTPTAPEQSVADEVLGSSNNERPKGHDNPASRSVIRATSFYGTESNHNMQRTFTMNNRTKAEERASEDIYQKAARLLHQSLSLEDEGGVVFFDTMPDAIPSPLDRRDSTFRQINRDQDKIAQQNEQSQSYAVWLHKREQGQCRVIASVTATDRDAAWSSPRAGLKLSHHFIPISVDDLHEFIKRYPHGRLWTFDDAEDNVFPTVPGVSAEQIIADSRHLSQAFPSATSLFILPVWDTLSLRWSALFAYSTSKFRTFTPDIDVPHMISFCNCIALERTRVATAAADKQKGDFIGSISHELRSPLHGILASCELLQDTGLSDFQQSFIDTANSCGRTLLDSISMILDYSKINSIDRGRQTARQKRLDIGGRDLAAVVSDSSPVDGSQNAPMLTDIVDLAAIVEEVVEGASIGHTYHGAQHLEISDIGSHARGQSRRFSEGLQMPSASKRSVEVILDISNSSKSSWLYLTKPGSFRRIVMNLVGNAIKYTQDGWIKVSLNIERTNGQHVNGEADSKSSFDASLDIVTFSVIDTGIGISSEFLDNKIFMPFAQEDSLAPGTGLGLSMVKHLLELLEGDIHIESTLKRGTSVTVRVPMRQKVDVNDDLNAKLFTTIPVSVDTSGSSLGESNIDLLHRHRLDQKVAFFSDEPNDAVKVSDIEILRITERCLDEYITGWYDMKMLQGENSEQNADIVITNDFDLDALLASLGRDGARSNGMPCVIVLCSSNTRNATYLKHQGHEFSMEFISKPFGPYKLASAIISCLIKLENVADPKRNVESSSANLRRRAGSQDIISQVRLRSQTIHQDVHNMSLDGGIRANEESSNAVLALKRTSSSNAASASETSNQAVGGAEFPFPVSRDSDTGRSFASGPKCMNDTGLHVNRPTVLDAAIETSEINSSNQSQRSPRFLLVDDNAINLKILHAFMKKLKYTEVSLASDGSEACKSVEAALARNKPFDVVFLDLSMPVMDGFEAARRIRNLELSHNNGATSLMMNPSPALIIALTGLAREKDQTKAFGAGVDLYMTKPASFKEVARLMKNWEANGGVDASDSLPHGSVTGGEPGA